MAEVEEARQPLIGGIVIEASLPWQNSSRAAVIFDAKWVFGVTAAGGLLSYEAIRKAVISARHAIVGRSPVLSTGIVAVFIVYAGAESREIQREAPCYEVVIVLCISAPRG